VYGIERTGEGLGVRGWRRVEEIGAENEQIVKLVVEAVKYPYSVSNPVLH
jgi:hypothetical protein